MIGKHISKFATIALILALLLGVSLASAARDTIPPTAPVLSVAEVGSAHVTLTWTPSTDDGQYIWYFVYTNGTSQFTYAGANTSVTVLGLTPATTYSFTVRSRDNGINWSLPSNAVTVTTTSNSGDTTPPTTPSNLRGFDQGCGENRMTWNQSTDNVDPQVDIHYEIFVNGIARPESTVYGRGGTIAYADVTGSNTFEVFAVDSAGNRSAPASITMQMSPPC
jgi:VCBS repeat-containing protein